MKLAVPSTIMITLDWWVWEFMILISGLLGVKEQAACILIMNIVSLAVMIGFGLEQASCTLIGQEIGRGEISLAKQIYNEFLKISTILILITCFLVWKYKSQYISIFTENDQIYSTATQVIYLISLNTFPDCFKGMLKGVIKALGLQKKCVYVNISGHWFINLTLQYLLAFHFELGLKGMWIAKVILEFYICVMYYIIVYQADWQKMSQMAI